MRGRTTDLGIGLGLAAILALAALDSRGRRRPPHPPPPPPSVAATPRPPSPTPEAPPPSPRAATPAPSPPPEPPWRLARGASESGQRLWGALQGLAAAAGTDLATGGLAAPGPSLAARRDLARRVAAGDLDLPVRILLDTWAAWLETNLGSALGPDPPGPPEPVPELALGCLALRQLAALEARTREFEALLGNELVLGLQAERADAEFLATFRRRAHALETRWRETLGGLLVEDTGGLPAAVMVLGHAEGPLATRALAEARVRLRDRPGELSEPTREAWLEALARDLEGPTPPCEDRLAALRELDFGGAPEAAAHAAGLFLRLSARCPGAVVAGDGARLAAVVAGVEGASAGRRAWLARSRMGDLGAETAALVAALERLAPRREAPSPGAAAGLPPPRLGF